MLINFSHHRAMESSRSSAKGDVISCIPIGRPDMASPAGRVMVGSPQEVQGPWNLVSPVFVRSAREGVGVEGVISTSTCSASTRMSAENLIRLSCALLYVTASISNPLRSISLSFGR